MLVSYHDHENPRRRRARCRPVSRIPVMGRALHVTVYSKGARTGIPEYSNLTARDLLSW
jgi:hypothetical protein